MNSGQNASAAPRKEAEKAPGCRREHHQALRTAYLSDVQRALDKSSYRQFYEALLAYKKTDNYDAMVSVIATLTTERPQDFHLLQRFYMFVRPHHKEQFRELCKDLTGLVCGDGEKQLQQLEQSEGKPQSLESCTKGISHLQDTATSKSGAPEKIQTKISSFCFSQKSELELPKTEVSKETNNVRAPTDSGVVPIFPLEMEPECGRFHCSSCKSEDDVPFKCPLCDFTCCKTCWKQFLKVVKKCPKCHSDVKRQRLIQVFFWS